MEPNELQIHQTRTPGPLVSIAPPLPKRSIGEILTEYLDKAVEVALLLLDPILVLKAISRALRQRVRHGRYRVGGQMTPR